MQGIDIDKTCTTDVFYSVLWYSSILVFLVLDAECRGLTLKRLALQKYFDQLFGILVFQYSSIPSIGCRVQRIDIEEMQCSGRKTAITVGCPPQSQWDSDHLIGG